MWVREIHDTPVDLVEDVDHRRRIEAVALADHEALADGDEVERGDEVVEALHRVAGAERAEMEHRLAHLLEQRPRALDVGARAADT